MSGRRKVEERIKKKKQEIQELEAQTREARAYIQALQDVLKMLPRDKKSDAGAVLRSGSAIAQARDAILEAGRPLHISTLLRTMGREMTRNSRSSLSGSLAAYVRRGEMFNRTGPNTFGLVEMEGALIPAAEELPKDFGLDDDVDVVDVDDDDEDEVELEFE